MWVAVDESGTKQETMATAATAAGGTGSGGPATGQSGSGTSVGRKKDGGPSSKYWENSETINQLESVRQWIGKHYKKVGHPLVLATMLACLTSIDRKARACYHHTIEICVQLMLATLL